MLNINFKKLSEFATTPEQSRITDSGFDLFTSEPVTLAPFQDYGDTLAIPTGISFDIPEEHEGCVRPRSGLSLRGELLVWYGTVDEEYTGEVKVIVTNLTDKPQFINRGFKIAQIVFQPRPHATLTEVAELIKKERGDKGFGSSGYGSVTEDVETSPSVQYTLFPEEGQVYQYTVDRANGKVPLAYYLVKEVTEEGALVDVFLGSEKESPNYVLEKEFMLEGSTELGYPFFDAFTELVTNQETIEEIKSL